MTGSWLAPILEQASAKGGRSTALHPLQWAFGLVLAALVGVAPFTPPAWLMISLLALAGVILVMIIIAYVFFMRSNPDYLRSENYTLQKMAIERGVFGDSITGLMPRIDMTRTETGGESDKQEGDAR